MLRVTPGIPQAPARNPNCHLGPTGRNEEELLLVNEMIPNRLEKVECESDRSRLVSLLCGTLLSLQIIYLDPQLKIPLATTITIEMFSTQQSTRAKAQLVPLVPK